MSLEVIYGVDPGANGAIAVIAGTSISFYKLPFDKDRVLSYPDLDNIFSPPGYVFIETALAKTDGRRARKCLLAQGIMYGKLAGFLESKEHIAIREVAPREWQKGLGLAFRKGFAKDAVKDYCLRWNNAQKIKVNLEPWKNKRSNEGARDALSIALFGQSLLRTK